MFTDTTMLYLYTETPLHAGVGSGLSSIDLPIQRERTTQYPMLQGSGIKGKLRATAEEAVEQDKFSPKDVEILFGPSRKQKDKNGGSATPTSPTTSEDYAGALVAGDARILLFPVRSLNGVFAYTTSSDVLNRFQRDIERNTQTRLGWQIPDFAQEQNTFKAFVTTNSEVQANNTTVLEEYSYDTQSSTAVDDIAKWIAEHALPDLEVDTYWSNKLKSSLVILPNDDFRDFALYATEVITRISINREKKTASGKALWTEEHLPTDTLLYVPMYATKARNGVSTWSATTVLEKAKTLPVSYLQLGGDETVGRGIVRTRWGN